MQAVPGATVGTVATASVQVSYDDGTTWRDTQVKRNGTGWVAVLNHPKSGFVSLRAQAADSNGNKVVQTIIRAYQLN